MSAAHLSSGPTQISHCLTVGCSCRTRKWEAALLINLPPPSYLQWLSAESGSSCAIVERKPSASPWTFERQRQQRSEAETLRLLGAPLYEHLETPSDKRGLQFAPVHLTAAFALRHVPLGFDHGGQVRCQVHRRPGPATTPAQLQSHALPLPLRVRTLRASRVPGASVGLPGTLKTDRGRDVVQVQRRFGVQAAGSGRRRLGFAAGTKRRPRRRR